MNLDDALDDLTLDWGLGEVRFIEGDDDNALRDPGLLLLSPGENRDCTRDRGVDGTVVPFRPFWCWDLETPETEFDRAVRVVPASDGGGLYADGTVRLFGIANPGRAEGDGVVGRFALLFERLLFERLLFERLLFESDGFTNPCTGADCRRVLAESDGIELTSRRVARVVGTGVALGERCSPLRLCGVTVVAPLILLTLLRSDAFDIVRGFEETVFPVVEERREVRDGVSEGATDLRDAILW